MRLKGVHSFPLSYSEFQLCITINDKSASKDFKVIGTYTNKLQRVSFKGRDVIIGCGK